MRDDGEAGLDPSPYRADQDAATPVQRLPSAAEPTIGTRLLVASTGGHLVEMRALAPRLVPQARNEIWVTFDSHQSRSLLAYERVEFVRDTPPRDWRGVLFN